MSKNIIRKEVWLHVLGAISFLALPILFNPRPNDWQVLLHNFRTLQEVVVYVLLIGYFYLNYHVLIPRYFFARKFLIYGISTIACLFITIILPDLVSAGPPAAPGPMEITRPPFGASNQPGVNGQPDSPFNNIFHLGQNIFLFLIVLLFSLMVRIRNRLKTSEKEKLNAEISFLKAQINPHFLFNSLNGIYALALLKSNDTAPAIVKLSNMMRYVLTEASAEIVSLQKEIEYLKNYIELQQLRFGDSLKLTFTTQGDAHGKSIAPMLVIPLIENAFKYGVSPEEASFIKIDISITGNTVHFNIENKKVNVHLVEKTGVGLKNTRMRLDLLYANRYSFHIQETETQYTVSLTLQV